MTTLARAGFRSATWNQTCLCPKIVVCHFNIPIFDQRDEGVKKIIIHRSPLLFWISNDCYNGLGDNNVEKSVLKSMVTSVLIGTKNIKYREIEYLSEQDRIRYY